MAIARALTHKVDWHSELSAHLECNRLYGFGHSLGLWFYPFAKVLGIISRGPCPRMSDEGPVTYDS